MDFTNLITSSNYALPENGIANPVLNKITEVTGYQWKMYSPSADILSNFYPTIHNFLLHNWIGIIVTILMVIVLGEVLFYRAIKKEKVQYTESNNSYVLKHKILSYILSFMILVGLFICAPVVVILISIILLNILMLIVVALTVAAYVIILTLILFLGIKIIVSINKMMFGHLIKKETQEEYEARQATYKFRDGTLVKIKPNLVEDVTIIDDHKVTHRLERMSKEGTVCIIKKHNDKGKATLEEVKDDTTSTPRWECFLEEASQEEKDKFIKEREEHKIKQDKLNKRIVNRFFNWCIELR